MNFVVKERLCWPDLNPKDTAPFKDPATGNPPSTTVVAHKLIRRRVGDIKILYNDWPYGIDERIVHLVVWTKFSLPDDPSTQELTKEMRREIDEYVNRTFCQAVPRDNNWKALKSIHSVEHFHVMLFDPDPAFIEEIIEQDLDKTLRKVLRLDFGRMASPNDGSLGRSANTLGISIAELSD
ncbi:MAG: hypothetical protein Q9182_000210 [Xanthomendoza sp. 2 TL-2023]